MTFFVLLGLALGPGIAIAIYIYLKDKHEREPLGLLLISFLYGVASTLLTLIVSVPVHMMIVLQDGDDVHEFFDAFLRVALVEEFCKFVFIRFILYYNRDFNEPFDGIVYAVMVGMGFATLENLMYVFQYGVPTGIIRMFTAVPAHATFAVLMGFFLGRAKFTHNNQLLLSLMGLATATVFHGAYDYFWFIANNKGAWGGIWMGAIISLIIAFILSRKAIRIHQQASPFVAAAVDKSLPATGEEK